MVTRTIFSVEISEVLTELNEHLNEIYSVCIRMVEVDSIYTHYFVIGGNLTTILSYTKILTAIFSICYTCSILYTSEIDLSGMLLCEKV